MLNVTEMLNESVELAGSDDKKGSIKCLIVESQRSIIVTIGHPFRNSNVNTY